MQNKWYKRSLVFGMFLAMVGMLFIVMTDNVEAAEPTDLVLTTDDDHSNTWNNNEWKNDDKPVFHWSYPSPIRQYELCVFKGDFHSPTWERYQKGFEHHRVEWRENLPDGYYHWRLRVEEDLGGNNYMWSHWGYWGTIENPYQISTLEQVHPGH